ncbi:hypothetical protein Tco_1547435 [Tanacetum coccineum]
MVHQLTKFHVQRVDIVINPPWNLPFLGAKGLTSPEKTATVEMVFSQPWTCTFLVAKGLTTPELMANCANKQQSIAMFSADAEDVAAAGCCANILWIKSEPTDYDIIYEKVPIFCNNTSAIAISNNLILH